MGIFHPMCTYLTVSEAWAFNDPDYEKYPEVGFHQRVKPETLVCAPRHEARERAAGREFRHAAEAALSPGARKSGRQLRVTARRQAETAQPSLCVMRRHAQAHRACVFPAAPAAAA